MASTARLKELLGPGSRLKRNLFLIFISAVLLLILWIIYTHINIFPKHDFIEYWASGRLNITGRNPYDADQMLILEQMVGWNKNKALMMLNPPWILPFAMFYGLFDYPFSRFLGFLSQISIIYLYSILLWKIYNGSKRTEWISWIAVLSFGPILHALKTGQVTILVLLGSVGFIYCLNNKNDFWAGIFASLLLVKPQLLYLVVYTIILWSISRRLFNVLIGMLIALITCMCVTLIFNPQVLSQYITMMRSYPLEIWMTSTIGAYLRSIIGLEKFYIQFIPAFFGVAWFLIYWARHQKSFDWITILPLIILISIATNPYGWTFDSAVCVWCVVQIALLFDFSHWTLKKILIFTIYWSINYLILFLSASQNWFWWFPIFLLVRYLLSYYHLTWYKIKLTEPNLAMIE
jgi:hypothetical protein